VAAAPERGGASRSAGMSNGNVHRAAWWQFSMSRGSSSSKLDGLDVAAMAAPSSVRRAAGSGRDDGDLILVALAYLNQEWARHALRAAALEATWRQVRVDGAVDRSSTLASSRGWTLKAGCGRPDLSSSPRPAHLTMRMRKQARDLCLQGAASRSAERSVGARQSDTGRGRKRGF